MNTGKNGLRTFWLTCCTILQNHHTLFQRLHHKNHLASKPSVCLICYLNSREQVFDQGLQLLHFLLHFFLKVGVCGVCGGCGSKGCVRGCGLVPRPHLFDLWAVFVLRVLCCCESVHRYYKLHAAYRWSVQKNSSRNNIHLDLTPCAARAGTVFLQLARAATKR